MLITKKLRYLRQLQRQQWLTSAELSELQNRNLRRLIAHAYTHVPYYKQLFDEYGILPTDINGIDDLPKIPVLTKKILQQGKGSNSLAGNIAFDKLLAISTSGSTGLPLTIRRTEEEDIYGGLRMTRAVLANGIRPWQKRVNIVAPKRITGNQSLWRRISRKTYSLPATLDVLDQIKILRRFNPQLIFGYKSSLERLAHAVERFEVKDITPRFVVSTAELLKESTRDFIDRVFGVRMIDIYASVEANCIAWECPDHYGYHLDTDTLVVEFIRDGKPVKKGEPGRIVITLLYRYAMPLVRYDLGDIGIPSGKQCPCGRGLPLMEMIQGRADDFITLPGGGTIAPTGAFANSIEDKPGVMEYRVIQEDYDLITIELVVDGVDGLHVAGQVKRDIEDLVQNEAAIRVKVVDCIDRKAEDKIRRIISKVPTSF